MTPPRLAAWLEALPRDDALLQAFGRDVGLIVEHGLAPRVAAGALLRVRADEQFGVRRGDLTSEAPRRADWRGGARPFTPARSSTELELAAPRPVIVRCRACSFSVSLPLAEARQAFAAHKCAPVPVIAEAP